MKEKRGNVTSKGGLEKDECAFCHDERHCKKDCPKLKRKIRASLFLTRVLLSIGVILVIMSYV